MVLRTHIPDASPAIRPAIRPGVSRVMVLTFVLGILSGTAHAQDASWFDRVLTTKAEQPRWMTPLVTVTPRLEQEFRYDMLWRRDPRFDQLRLRQGPRTDSGRTPSGQRAGGAVPQAPIRPH